MKLAASLAVILMATTVQAHPIRKASPGCTAFMMAFEARSQYRAYKDGYDLASYSDPAAQVMWLA